MRTRQERSEQAAAYFDELKSAAQNAPRGQTFDQAEALATLRGRELIQQSLETILQEQIDDFEKKGIVNLIETVPSFRRKPESRGTGCKPLASIPACAGMTNRKKKPNQINNTLDFLAILVSMTV